MGLCQQDAGWIQICSDCIRHLLKNSNNLNEKREKANEVIQSYWMSHYYYLWMMIAEMTMRICVQW